MDALTAMQGNEEGYGKGLTTYPDSQDQEQVEAHAACLELEAEGKCRRYLDASGPVTQPGLVRYIVWWPVDAPDVVADQAVVAGQTFAPAPGEDIVTAVSPESP